MSLVSRLTSALRSAAHTPSVRRSARSLGRAAVRAATRQQRSSGGERSPLERPRQHQAASGGGAQALADRAGRAPLSFDYAPRRDGHPDPGEIVWGWVPYEEDLSQGKDRPVLVIAEEDASTGGADGSGEVLIALMLTSRDRADEGEVTTDQHSATWVDIGSGDWDGQGRPSEVRADRLLRLPPEAVRREGARLDRERYDRVAAAVRSLHGWG